MKKTHTFQFGVRGWRGNLIVGCAVLFSLAGTARGSVKHAQFCNPALVSYLMRDEQGNPLTEEALQTIAEQLPKSSGDTRVYAGPASLSQDGRRFYRQESLDWAKGKEVPALHFINNASCAMQLGTVTLTYHGTQMQLSFNMVITRTQPDRLRRWVIDALPFQEGAFVLDVAGGPSADDEVIPATRWHRLKATPSPKRQRAAALQSSFKIFTRRIFRVTTQRRVAFSAFPPVRADSNTEWAHKSDS